MKIKQVCEATGLTDRAIRYYIEEGLIAPAYTENYLGRKAFDFSEEDVEALYELATLRRFGFTVEAIRQMMSGPAAVDAAIDAMVNGKESQIARDQELLGILNSLPEEQMTMSELARWIAKPGDSAELPEDQGEPDGWERIVRWCRNAFTGLMAQLPLVYIVNEWIRHALYERYACVEGWGWLVLTLVPLLALLTLSLLWLCGMPESRRAMNWLLVICLIWQPLSYACAGRIFGMSETTDIGNYMKLDHGCNVHWFDYFDLFPAHPGYGEKEYYYRFDPDQGMYDIYAEWTLPADQLEAEITRMKEMFASGRYGFHFDDGIHQVQTENFTCLFSVDPMHLPLDGQPSIPFRHMIERHYFYAAFAWNEETGRVRYCLGDYFSGDVDYEPYYLSLEW